MTNEEHNRYIGWAFLANGLFQVMMLLFVFAFLYIFFAIDPPGGGELPPAFLALMFGFIGLINLLFLSPNFIAAYALLKKKPWARIAGIIAAALSAMNVPIGTAAAVYSLWFFCGEQWKEVYSDSAAPARREPLSITPGREDAFDSAATEEEGAYVYRTPPPPDWR